MENNKSSIIAVIAVLVVLVGGIGVFAANKKDKDTTNTSTSTSQSTPAATPKPTETKPAASADIVGLAVATPDLSTLVAAVKAADLVTTLQSAGPFTVFAPTNAAFSALPAGTLDSLLLPENKAKLAGILTYHVVAGKVMAADLKNGQVVTTVQGGKLTVNIANGKVTLKDENGGISNVTATDIQAKNGVVHVIDAVVLPL
jgi:uncharacterized surface protein with fasciclin (FAS1) repeats